MVKPFWRERAFFVVLVAALLFAAIYVALDFNRLYALRVGSNTGSYLQAALHFLHTGSSDNFGDWHPELTIHDQWTMLLLVPFVALFPRPETVIVIQVIALSLTAPAAYVLLRMWGAKPGTAAALAIAFLCTPSMQGFAYNEFVPLDFVPFLSCLLMIALRREALLWIAVMATLLCGTKEDVGLFIAWFAVWYALLRNRRIGATIAAVVIAQLAVFYAIDAVKGTHTLHPGYGLHDPHWPAQLAFTLEMLAPFAFAPLAVGWRIVLAAPLAAELFLAQGWAFPLGQAGNYYTIPFVIVIALAAWGVLSSRERWARIAVGCTAVMALFFNTTVLHFGRHPFPVDPQYAAARSWATSNRAVAFPCEDQGAFVVAAANPNAKLVGCDSASAPSHLRGAWSAEALNSSAAWTRGAGG
ncbi:MAG TPA: DUF2079 domain-containing protein [Candidatus Aquilonibacter sp.]|nr:DUF2079 domain-containing protein [Candidatus Aquilonibacter sp.]